MNTVGFPKSAYIFYGLFIVLISVVGLGMLLSLALGPSKYYDLGLFTVPLFLSLLIGVLHLVAASMGRTNRLSDLSIKIGAIPSMSLVAGGVLVFISEEVFKKTLFPENPGFYIVLPTVLICVVVMSYFLFLVGFFRARGSKERGLFSLEL